MKEKKEKVDNLDENEDTTEYGEFITSYFAWIPMSTQKEKANEIDKMTKKQDKERK